MTFFDGSPVSYIGMPHNGVAVGDCGQLLNVAGRGAHVKWASGSRQGAITLEDTEDLVPRTAGAPTSSDSLEDSLEVGAPGHLGLAHLCALRGPGAVLATIAHSRPADLMAVAEEVRAFAEHRVAATATVREVTSQLDEEEAGELVRLAAMTVIRDTFGLADG